MNYQISSFNSSVQEKFAQFLSKKNIEEQCTEESLTELKEAFMNSEMKKMDKIQLQNAFKNILHIFLNDEEFDIIFKKINAKNDGLVDWDEFISYLLLEMKCKDVARHWQPMDPPITGIPILKRSHHRNPIFKIIFYPDILLNRNWNFLRGCYLTASKDGSINYLSIDLKYQRSVKSSNPLMKFQTTMITDIIAMPDIRIVCTSSVERDLRFYDTVGNRFDLRVMITHFQSAIVSMNYYFSQDIKEESFIILGDMNGGVKLFSFSPIGKGPFKHFTKQDVLQIQYNAILADELENLKVREFNNLHGNWVSQVAYYGSLKSFISCSKCSENSLIITNPSNAILCYKFHVAKGINCFDFCEDSQILVTGGVDFLIKVWNPFITKKAKITFHGHQAPISAIFIQNNGKRIFSLSQDRCIRVFDVFSRTCMQTYRNLPKELGNNFPISAVFNNSTQKMIIANQTIAIVDCGKVIDDDISDGYSHTKSVSCVLYNYLFQVIVSTSLDSSITVWNPWLGQRLSFISQAHGKRKNEENHSGIEITAACFDNTEQLLVTGARDGSIKLWQFNTGTCLREMMAEPNSEITGLAWYDNKILSVGWDRVITEFTETELGIFKKSWEIRHTDDITCLSIRNSQALVTASYNGEIILWRLETGQPYRIFLANNPTGRKVIDFRKNAKFSASKDVKSIKSAQKFTIQSEETTMRPVGVTVALFLNSRTMAPNIGTLMIALESGLIQVWTHHPGAGFLEAFSAIHKYGDFVTSMATDPKNDFLLTGHKEGYIKVWLIKNYLLPNPPKTNMCELRLEFPFLWKDRINGRAKRAVKDQPIPVLLTSLRGHKQTINAIQIIPEARIIISGSSDHTIKLWTLSGRYISTLGTFKPWTPILPNIPVQNYLCDYQLPAEVKKSASFTTMKVLQGGIKLKVEKDKLEKDEVMKKLTEESSANLSLSSDDFADQSNHLNEDLIFDNSAGYIPVYNYLKTDELERVIIPAPLLI